MVLVAAMADVAPFPFDRLQSVPALAIEPLRAVARAARATTGWSAALDALRSSLATDVHVGVVDVRFSDPRTPVELPGALVALRVELPSGIAIAELDPSTAVALVDAALGTTGDDPAAFRPLREVEMGVLAFLAARFVLAAQLRGGRLLGWTTDPRTLAFAVRRAPYLSIRLDVTVADRVLGARLWLPVASAVLPAPPPDLTAYRDLPVRLGAEVGTVTLSGQELADLAAGDVVLLDESEARPVSGVAAGRARLRVIGARVPWFGAVIEADGAHLRVESQLVDEEMVPMGQKETVGGSSSLGPLAAEVPVEVVVELGRMSMTVGVLSSLAPGEIVVLDRAPTDPVTLTAGGRVLGRGELVVVEGQVGVRILDVARR